MEKNTRPDSLIDLGAIQVLYLFTYLLTLKIHVRAARFGSTPKSIQLLPVKHPIPPKNFNNIRLQANAQRQNHNLLCGSNNKRDATRHTC